MHIYRFRLLPSCLFRLALTLSIAISAISPGSGAMATPAGSNSAAGATPTSNTVPLFDRVATTDAAPTVRWDAGQLALARQSDTPITVPDFPLHDGFAVDLRIRPFNIVSPRTRFVLGRPNGADIPLDFDATRVALFRGNVVSFPDSHVYLAISDHGSIGWVDLGAGEQRFAISSVAPTGGVLPPGRLSVIEQIPLGGVSLPVPMCGLDTAPAADKRPSPIPPIPEGPPPIRGLQQIELAVETDFEYFELFGDVNAAAAYVVAMYGAVSDIYIRDVNARFDLTFVRIWDDPNDLFNEPDPLRPFRNYWNANMGHVQRDVAQFFTGRRDLAAGGVAWLSSLCGSNAYSWAGYALGFMADPAFPSVFNRDITVTAHELGHSCGTPHTHDLNLDDCNLGIPPAQRGSIMSYCGQTFTGGDANMDLRFHAVVQLIMEDFIVNESACIADDCNQNGIDDALDIQAATSPDLNNNGIPDECEDCNNNGVLDDEDIRNGFSLDLNGNGVPDECEPDCNSNKRPDDLDISLGFSEDDNSNNIPDECEPDLNGNGILDYSEIQADMSRDLDRNITLDDFQDCDGNGTPDLIELQSANNVWAASLTQTGIREYLWITGTLVQSGPVGIISEGTDLIITPTGRILVASGGDDRIVEFDRSGLVVGNFVAPGSGGLDRPTGMLLGPNGSLFVTSYGTVNVLEYDGSTGAFIREFVAAGSGGLLAPYGLTFGPNGNLFVTSSDNRVIEYDGQSGALIGDFVSIAGNGTLNGPRGLAFKPDGNLLVASYANDSVLEYDGQSGAFIGKWNRNGTPERLTLDEPWTIRLGPDGNVYVSRSGAHGENAGGGAPGLHLTDARIYQFDIRNGNMITAYLLGDDTNLERPAGFDFYPNDAHDCNLNLRPDNCDIASGASRDVNNNGVPDECECVGDLNGDNVVDLTDLGILLADFGCTPPGPCVGDLDGDGDTDLADLGILLADFGQACP